MNEIPKILEPKEKIIYDGKPEYLPYLIAKMFVIIFVSAFFGFLLGIFLKSILLGVIIGIVIFVVGIIITNMAYARKHYAITNKRAIIQTGIIGRDFKSIEYDKMQNVSVDVGILGVIFKVGTLKIFTGEMRTVGGRNPQIQPQYDRFEYIASPYEVLKELQTNLSARKEKLS